MTKPTTLSLRALAKQSTVDRHLLPQLDALAAGRIVFDTKKGCFFLYADRKLQAASTIAAVVAIFGLQDSKVIVLSDAHYRSNRSLAVPPPA